MMTIRFWKQAIERALKSAAQGVLLGLGLGEGFNLFDVDPMMALGFAGGAALLSLLTSVASAPFGEDNSPSVVE